MKTSNRNRNRLTRRWGTTANMRRKSRIEPLEDRNLLAAEVLNQTPDGTVGDAVTSVVLDLSEALVGDAARDPANYLLTHLGDDNALGGGDDSTIPVLPQYNDGATQIELAALVDLTDWTEMDYGFPAGVFGDWQTDVTGASTTQSLNGGATFFVSDDGSIDAAFSGRLAVETMADDDFVGLVFGFQEDATTGLPANYYLLSWKAGDQGTAEAGLRLAKISGTGTTGEHPDLWDLSAADPHVELLATGPTTAWQPDTPYDFRIDYASSGAIDINVERVSDGQSIWQTSLHDAAPLGAGRSGFYNFSQPDTRYWRTLEGGTLPDGTYQIEAFSGPDALRGLDQQPLDGDGDGTAGGDYVGSFTIDIGEATVDVDLVAASDSGVSQTDNLTNDDTPEFDVTVNRAGTIQLFDGPGITPIATQPVVAGGTFSLTAPTLSEGGHEIRARFIPTIGNPVEDTELLQIDTTGPQMSAGPASEQAPITSRPFEFNESVNPATVIPANLSLFGPGGTIPVLAASGADHSYQVEFDPIFAGGPHVLVADVAIEDLAGNRLDQDQDGNPGEVGQDEGIDLFTLIPDSTAPGVVSFTPIGARNVPVDEFYVVFSEPLDEASLTPGDVSVTGPAGPVNVTGIEFVPGQPGEVRITMPLLQAEGAYQVTLGPNVTDIAQNAMATAFAAAFSIDVTGPQVVDLAPSGIVNGSVDHVDVTFSEAIRASTFSAGDIQLSGPQGSIPVTGVTSLTADTFRVHFAAQSANGTYAATVTPAIEDLAGNLLDQDGDRTGGEVDEDDFDDTFEIAVADLQIAVSPLLGDLEHGETIIIDWSVTNVGTVTALAGGTWQDAVWLSQDGVIDANDRLLGQFASPVSALAGGSDYDNSQQVTIPLDAAISPGSYQILVATDVNGGVAESDDSNNVAATQIVQLAFPPVPDLFVTAVSPVPLTALPGEEITVDWTLANSAATSATGIWTEQILLSPVGQPGTEIVIATVEFAGTVVNGAPVARQETVAIPTLGVGGAYDVQVRTNANEGIFELNSSNNTATSAAPLDVGSVLSVSLPVTQILESAANPALQGIVTRSGPTDMPLVVTLNSSAVDEATVPASVTVAAGQHSATFPVDAVADGISDGPQFATVTATAADHISGVATLTVIDVDLQQLTLSLDMDSIDEGATVVATVSREVASSVPVNVAVASSLPTQAIVPATVQIPAGQLAETFSITSVDDNLLEALREAVIEVTADGLVGASRAIMLTDNDTPELLIAADRGLISEGDGAAATVATVTRDIVSDRAVVIDLDISDLSEATLPARVVIPANEASVSFAIDAVDDEELDGTQIAMVTARPIETLTGRTYNAAIGTLFLAVTDDDGPALQIAFDRDLAGEGLAQAAMVTVSRNTGTVGALTIDLASSDTGELVVPSQVEIPNGADSVTFAVTTIDDGESDGNQTVAVTAGASGFAGANDLLVVTDVDLPDLVVSEVEAMPIIGTQFLTDDSFRIRYRLENTGLTEAISTNADPGGGFAGSFLQRVSLSDDPFVGNDLLLGSFVFEGTLPVDQFFERTITSFAPRVAGDYWVVVQTDLGEEVIEGIEGNNTRITASPITIERAYSATVQTDVTVGLAGDAVLMTGSATATGTSAPAPFELVNIHINLRGTTRIISALTDESGQFSVTFTPLPGEAGSYTIGAAHPGDDSAAIQDSFVLQGIRGDALPPLEIIDGETAEGGVSISNLSDLPLSGLEATVVDKPDNLSVAVSFAGGADALAGLASVPLDFSITADDATIPTGEVHVRVTSNEGATLDLFWGVSVVSLVPQLVADTPELRAAMLVGDQRAVQFDITNAGGAASGELAVQLPAAPWLSLASEATIPSLQPGASARITLLLTPAADLALTEYSGSLLISNAEASLLVPFAFRAVSDAMGDLSVHVVDELFYFTEEAPSVADATVILRDPFTYEELYRGTTGAGGFFTQTGLPEGYYTLDVRADEHESSRTTIFVEATAVGQTNDELVFLSRETIQYTWTVEETEVEDVTNITIDSTFETNVPIPVVTVENGQIDLSRVPNVGDEIQIDMTLTNHGLIAAQDVAFNFGSHPYYEITPLISNIGVMPAQSSLTIPVTVRRIADESTSVGFGGGGVSVPCSISGGLTWKFQCGPFDVSKVHSIPIYNIDAVCTSSGGPGGAIVAPPAGPGGPGGVIQVNISSDETECLDCFAPIMIGCALNTIPGAGCAFGILQFAGSGESSDAAWATVGCISELVPGGGWFVCAAQLYDCISMASSASGGHGGGGTGIPAWADEFARYFEAAEALEATFFGTNDWFNEMSGVDADGFMQAFQEFSSETSEGGRSLSAAERGFLSSRNGPEGVDAADVQNFIDRWNRSIDYYAQGIDSVGEVPQGQSTDFIDADALEAAVTEYSDSQAALEATGILDQPYDVDLFTVTRGVSTGAASAPRQGGVCATVQLQIEQQAVLTRTGFEANLNVINGSSTTPLTNVDVDLHVFDAQGNIVNHLFGIEDPTLRDVDQVDGAGTIATDTTASISWLIIPSDEAAPLEATSYFVGGTLGYTEGDLNVFVNMENIEITVEPDAALDLDYFHQRDVFSDDPFTPEIEPAEPFALAVMVQNNGAGVARNLRITSGQPEIVDNEKLLLIDFEIIASQVNNQNLTPSLTVDFGDVGAGETSVGLWLMTSSLQGHFVDYDATFEHVSPFGDPRLSIVKSVEIHEMIRQVYAGGAFDDLLPDFLVNEIPDPNDLPDTLFMSDGSRHLVGLGSDASVQGSVGAGSLSVTLDATMGAGFSYLRAPDPGNGDFRLVRVERSDGSDLRGENFWQTDRTFVGDGQPPIREDVVHLLDYDSTGSYTFHYVAADQTPPQVTEIVAVFPDPRDLPVSTIDVLFSEAIDATSFAIEDLSLTRNGGPNLIDASVTIAQISSTSYQIGGLDGLTALDGEYELTVDATGITDSVGNAGSGQVTESWIKGEAAPFVASLLGVTTGPRNVPIATLDVVFSEPLVSSSFNREDLQLTQGGGPNLIDESVAITQIDASTYRISGLESLTSSDGEYEFIVDATGVTGLNSIAGVGGASVAWRLDTVRPAIVSTGAIAPNPRNTPVDTVDVAFSEDLAAGSFQAAAVTLLRDGTAIDTTGIGIVPIDARNFRIVGLAARTAAEGDYELRIDVSAVNDLAGNSGNGIETVPWTMDLTAPAAAVAVGFTPDTGVVGDGRTRLTAVTVSGDLGETGLEVRIIDTSSGSVLAQFVEPTTHFDAAIDLGTSGQHPLEVIVSDAAGNLAAATPIDIFVDATPPVPAIEVVSPNPRNTPLDSVAITFTEPVVGLDVSDFQLIREGRVVSLDGLATLSTVDNVSWVLANLRDATNQRGDYTLTLIAADSLAVDLADNPIAGDASTGWHNEPADFNFDGFVDGVDFLLWQVGFGITEGAEAIDGDADGDGDVDGADFLLWQNGFSNRETGSGSTNGPTVSRDREEPRSIRTSDRDAVFSAWRRPVSRSQARIATAVRTDDLLTARARVRQ